jgi:hypothetical protein
MVSGCSEAKGRFSVGKGRIRWDTPTGAWPETGGMPLWTDREWVVGMGSGDSERARAPMEFIGFGHTAPFSLGTAIYSRLLLPLSGSQ